MIPFIARQMERHDTIVLEEPPDEGFSRMLTKSLEVDDYLMPLDVEYPLFSRQMCGLLRDLHASGKRIVQVEPYLAALVRVHTAFADGHGPDRLDRKSLLYPVYMAEHNATAALMDYYRTVMTGTFDETLQAICRFARTDAARFRLRDSLRVQALVSRVQSHAAVYIEAGPMHYHLWTLLRHHVRSPRRLKVLFLTDIALRTIGKKGRLYGPGDRLTLRYLYHPKKQDDGQDIILAARALIHSKIIEKEEKPNAIEGLPHLRNEWDCNGMVSGLSLADCRRLFPLLRGVETVKAFQIVKAYREETLAMGSVTAGEPRATRPQLH